MNKKIILFDVDGVLNTFDQDVLAILRPGTTLEEIEGVGDWDVFRLLNKEQHKHKEELLADPQFWMNLIPKPVSQQEVENARKNDNDVLFCTSPWHGCKEWDNTRRDWLKKYFNAKGREDTIITTRKDIVYGNIFIDDKPENITEWKNRWTRHGSYGILYETHANKFCDICPRIRVIDNKWEFIKK